MAQILTFPMPRAQRRTPSRHDRRGEIVFFCGVRVEYHDAAQAGAADPQPFGAPHSSPGTAPACRPTA